MCLRQPILAALSLLILASSTQARADDSRFQRWEEAIGQFEQQDREQPPPKNAILFVGSSSIRLWDLEQSFPDRQVINRGFGGSQIADSTHFADRIVLPYQPRVVVLYAGDNDLAQDLTPCQVHEDFLEFTRTVHAELPETRIVFIAIKPSIKRWNLIHRVRAANALVEASCVEDGRLQFVDVEPPMLGDDGRPRPEMFVEDGLHLSPAGYAIWSDLVRPHLSAAQ